MTRELADGTIEFRFYRPGVCQLCLAGDFNGWNTRSMPMIGEPNGWWVYRLRLAPGTYQFRYYGDGQWYTDYAAFGVERGPFGWNSVITVRAATRKAARRKADRTAA